MSEYLSDHDLIISGGTPAGLSIAIQAREAGLERVLVVEAGRTVAMPDLVGQHALEVHYQERVRSIRATSTGVVVETDAGTYHSEAFVEADHPTSPSKPPAYEIPSSLEGRIHIGTVPLDPRDVDVLVVGSGEQAIEWSLKLAEAGAGVVLAAKGIDPDRQSRVARRILLRLEGERLGTVMWHTAPDAIGELDGHPMAFFDDRRTPDLQFDHIVYALGPESPPEAFGPGGIELEVVEEGRVWWVSEDNPEPPPRVHVGAPGTVWASVRDARFPHLPTPYRTPRQWRPNDREQLAELRSEHYNATITHFSRAHSDLWVLRVRPDHGDTSHLPGQYASLGLGYWEPRRDGALEGHLDKRWNTLVRRSYSISSPIFDEYGYLVDPVRSEELEFYIVLVPPSAERVPALTPRLALKQPGDRMYLGPRVAGRYTLAPVTEPGSTVILLATGTGEAPHNAMTVELLRKGHYGPIVSVVSVRHATDLGYLDHHRILQDRFRNYHYLPLPTRDPGVPKRYVQDVIRDDELSDRFGVELAPDRTHVYLCGNPAMIGIPTWEDDVITFPEPVGAVQLLTERGFTIDRRGGERGNIHYEEYW